MTYARTDTISIYNESDLLYGTVYGAFLLRDDSVGATSRSWEIDEAVISTDQNPDLSWVDLTDYMLSVVTEGETDYLPIQLTINGGTSTVTYKIPIYWIGAT